MSMLRLHLLRAIAAMEWKRPYIERRWRYYVGEHDEKVLSPKFRETWHKFSEARSLFTNWCALVVDAPLSRLSIQGWKAPKSESAINRAKALWEANALDLESEEVHRHAMVSGEAFVIVWPRIDQDGQRVAGVYDISLQDETTMHVEYETRRRNDRSWAAKVWQDGRRWRAILYYPDEIVKLVTQELGENPQCPRDPEAFGVDFSDPGGPHDFGSVPVVRFSRDFAGRSKLDDVIPIQDRVNKLVADKLVAAEFGAFPQRWVLSNDGPPPEALRAGPGSVWNIPPKSTSEESGEEADTRVGQFPTTDLGNYDRTIQAEVNALFSVAQLPRHLLIDPGVATSAEAIKADEGPMVAAVRGYLNLFSAAWTDVMTLCGVRVESPAWQSVEVHNLTTESQAFQFLTQAGMPPRLAAEISMDLPEDKLALLPESPVLQPGANTLSRRTGEQPGEPQPPASPPPSPQQ